MIISELIGKMAAFYRGSIHDIDHMLRVWAYARTIGELEHLDPETLLTLEAAAVTHDIACPKCREKYGSALGRYQEEEGGPMARAFLVGSGLTDDKIERVVYLVAHHHTFVPITGADHQILVEADYIANASENGYSRENAENFIGKVMKTESGIRLLRSLYVS